MLGGSIFRYLTRYTTHDVIGTVRSYRAAQAIQTQGFNNYLCPIDLINENQIAQILSEIKPDFVLNCVGVIKQLELSKQPITSIKINSLLPHSIALICSSIGAKLVHFSTDCVFSGTRGNYCETDLPDTTDLYGRSKLLGEVNYDDHLTLRTSISVADVIGNAPTFCL